MSISCDHMIINKILYILYIHKLNNVNFNFRHFYNRKFIHPCSFTATTAATPFVCLCSLFFFSISPQYSSLDVNENYFTHHLQQFKK